MSVVVFQEGPQRPQESKDEDLFVVRLVAVVVLKKNIVLRETAVLFFKLTESCVTLSGLVRVSSSSLSSPPTTRLFCANFPQK